MLNSRVFQVFIASPSDLARERKAIPGFINRWNSENGESKNAFFVPRMWEFDIPQGGFDALGAQHLIDSRLLMGSDACFALFWSTLGSIDATGTSNTAHELDLIRNSGLPTYLWVKNSSIPTNRDLTKRTEVDSFVQQSRGNGYLTGSFNNTRELEKLLNRALDEIALDADKSLVGTRALPPGSPRFSVSASRSGSFGRVVVENRSEYPLDVVDLSLSVPSGSAVELTSTSPPGLLSPLGVWRDIVFLPAHAAGLLYSLTFLDSSGSKMTESGETSFSS